MVNVQEASRGGESVVFKRFPITVPILSVDSGSQPWTLTFQLDEDRQPRQKSGRSEEEANVPHLCSRTNLFLGGDY